MSHKLCSLLRLGTYVMLIVQ